MTEEEEFFPPVEIPITGELDLHTFRPNEIGDLVPHYLEECFQRGILRVRIIHGKGTGTLRRTVQHLLEKHPRVRSYESGNETSGSWGATVCFLHAPD